MFSTRDEKVFVISSLGHHILAVLCKVNEFLEKSVFSPRSEGFVITSLELRILAIFNKVNEFLENSVFSPRTKSYLIQPLAHHK